MKKTLAMVLAMGMTIASLTACGGSKPAETTAAATEAASSAADTKAETTEPAGGKAEGPITVVSREDGSGTRGAFIELFGIETKNDAGEKVDNTTEDAEITNSTSVMMTTIAGNKGAIGYVSLGSREDGLVEVELVSGLLACQDHAASRSAQGLVGGGGYHVCVRDRAHMLACCDQTGEVRHIYH